MKKRNFLVSNDGKYLYITFLGNSKNTGRIYYTDYSSGLEKLLNSGIFNTAVTNGTSKGNYLKFYYDKSQKTVYFHHIVFGFYYRNLTAENYNQVITSLSDELSGGSESKVIDHLNRDVYNNCKANLSLISQSENKRKDIAMKSKPFFNYIEAFDGQYYRTQFTYIQGIWFVARKKSPPRRRMHKLQLLHKSKQRQKPARSRSMPMPSISWMRRLKYQSR